MLMLADTFTELWFTPVFLLSCSFQIVKCLSTIERYSPEFPCYIHPQYLVFLFRKKEIFLCSLPDCEILGLYFRIYIYCIRCAKNRSIYRQMVASLSQRPFVVHIIIRSGDFTKTVDAKREVCAQGFKNVCQNALYPFHLLERPIDSISHLHIRGYKSEEYASCQILITQHLRNHLARLPSSPHCPNGCSFKHQFSSVQFSQGKLWSSPFEYSELYRCYALRLRTHLFQVQFRQSRLKETSSHPDDEVLRVANVRDSNQGCERNCQKPTDSLLFIALPRNIQHLRCRPKPVQTRPRSSPSPSPQAVSSICLSPRYQSSAETVSLQAFSHRLDEQVVWANTQQAVLDLEGLHWVNPVSPVHREEI